MISEDEVKIELQHSDVARENLTAYKILNLKLKNWYVQILIAVVMSFSKHLDWLSGSSLRVRWFTTFSTQA